MDAARAGDWQLTYEILSALDSADLGGSEHDALADAAWWLGRLEESLAARGRAHAAYAANHQPHHAAHAAWHLSYEHYFKGELAIANGWLKRAERHLDGLAESAEHGWLSVARSDFAMADSDAEGAFAEAEQARALGRRLGDPNLEAMATEKAGKALIARDEVRRGCALLDEAMVSVVAGELEPLFTGWIYCDVLDACAELGDLRRATEWTDAARRWTESLTSGNAYFSGVCRVHRVEVASLRGDWATAEAEAEHACRELMSFDPGVAAGAFYVAGEIRRRMGDLDRADYCFARAAELGRDPQPGLALVRLSQGNLTAAEAALRRALAEQPVNRPARARVLAARCEVAVAAGDQETAVASSTELSSIAERVRTDALSAMAAMAEGRVYLSRADAPAALARLRAALRIWHELGLPYEAAQTRALLAEAMRLEGDREGVAAELAGARAEFARLGAMRDVERIDRASASVRPPGGGLTSRQLEILRLVAEGRSNRQIAAELHISQHTVARHLSNILTKLNVPSRAAATAFAYTHGLI